MVVSLPSSFIRLRRSWICRALLRRILARDERQLIAPGRSTHHPLIQPEPGAVVGEYDESTASGRFRADVCGGSSIVVPFVSEAQRPGAAFDRPAKSAPQARSVFDLKEGRQHLAS